MNNLNVADYVAAVFGMLVSLGIIVAIVYDFQAKTKGELSISNWILRISMNNLWVVSLITAMLVLPIGILLGHFFWPQQTP